MKHLILILIVVMAAVGGYYYLNRGRMPQTINDSAMLPPIEERTNPLPQSGSTLLVGDVKMGQTITVQELTLSQDSYIAVHREVNGKRTQIGKSSLYKAGMHENISIPVSVMLNDADVIFLNVYNANGTPINDENNNPIEIKKNVGMPMSHYADEY